MNTIVADWHDCQAMNAYVLGQMRDYIRHTLIAKALRRAK